jgi:ribosome maturation factor RimP
MERETERAVSEILEPVVTSQGMELVDVEYKRGSHGWVLRIYIDKEDGVSLYDCVSVSNEVGTVLDVEDIFQSPYTLEVSSPRIRTRNAIEKRKNFKGTLLGCEKGLIQIDVDGQVFHIPLYDVAKANLEFEL